MSAAVPMQFCGLGVALEPVPAKVVTRPAAEIRRIRLLPVSETYTSPLAATATSNGEENWALPAAPSFRPAGVVPATSVTTPAGVTRRILLLAESATYRLPSGPMAIPVGSEKLAPAPVPLMAPPTFADPATVDTVPSGATLRIV